MIYVLETLFRQAEDSGLYRALLEPDIGITDPFELMALSNDDINGMQFKHGNKKQYLAIGQRNKLQIFRDLCMFKHHKGTPVLDVTTITLEEFQTYTSSPDFPFDRSTATPPSSSATSSSSGVTTRSQTARAQFMKGVKRDISLFFLHL